MTRKPPSETSEPDEYSRRARLAARRSRRTRVAAGVIVLVLAAAGGGVGAYVLNSHDPKAQAASNNDPGNPAPVFGVRGKLATAGAVSAKAPRALDHAHPLKLWVGGDSLAGSFGPALGDRVGATGIVKTLIDYRVSSGLWSNDIRDWYRRATEQMASDNPDAVVYIIGTNDTPVPNQVDSNGDGVPDWQAEYRMKVARMMDLFVGPNHRTVFWLGPPTLGTRSMDRGAQAIGDVMREEAAKRSPDVVYLDTYRLFSTKDGSYSRRILDENGNEIVARIGDGVHFSEDGAQYLSRAVFALVNARWHLLKQQDVLEPIGWTLAPGSGESVPGYSSRPTSRYRSSGSSSSSRTTVSVPYTGPTETSTVQSTPTSVVVTTVPTTVPVSTTPKTTAPPPTTAHTTPTTAKGGAGAATPTP